MRAPPSTAAPLAGEGLRAEVLRYFHAVVAGAAGLAVVVYAGFVTLAHPLARVAVTLWFAAVCAAAVAGLLGRRGWPPQAVLAQTLAVVAGLGLAAAGSGSGLQSPAMGFLPLIACLMGLAARRSVARWVSLGCVAVPVLLAWLEWRGLLPGGAVSHALPLPARVALHVAAVLAGLGGGRLMARVAGGHLAALAAANQAHEQSQQLLQRVLQASPDVITVTQVRTGHLVLVNPAFLRLTGWAHEADVVGRSTLALGVWADPADRQRLYQHAARHGAGAELELPFRMRDGREVRMRVAAALFEMAGEQYLVLNARDFTEAERLRLEREALFNNALVGIVFTRDQKVVMTNPRADQLLGWPPGALAGQGVEKVQGQPPATRWGQALQALARGEQVELELELLRRDGSRFPARLLGRAVDTRHPEDGNIWIVDDITQRKRDEAALAAARDQAEAASQAKSSFLANTSHEIRTPLNALVGLARLANEPGLGDNRRQQYLAQIADSAQTLSAVISDILDLSRIEAGRMRLEHLPFNLHELLASLHRGYAPLADAAGLHCTLELGLDVPRWVLGDALRVRQVLANYLANGLKFTSSGGLRLVVHSATAPPRVRFEVHDTGPGIAPAVLTRLFEPFTQGDDSTTRRHGGTGLGLAICRDLATLMNGEVGVRSEPGQGSCFWAELPLPEAEAAAPGAGPGAAQPLQGRRVLMVEDNPVNMLIGSAVLQRWGAEVPEATDGAQAVEQVLRAARDGRPFALVLMDLQMPGMGGLEAARLMRLRYPSGTLGIVALTAAALVSERDAALAAGMDGFVTKPVDEAQLLAAVSAALPRG